MPKAKRWRITGGSDAACQGEYLDLARKFPRFVMGANELSAQRVRISAQLEMQPTLAAQLAAAIGAAPGTGKPGEGVLDVALSLPVLKLKDFWIAQADAVAAKPFACASLTHLNSGFADFKKKIDITVPPPASDLTGVHFTRDFRDAEIGHKALAVNLSDLASMGARPLAFLCALAFPPRDARRLPGIAAGMAKLARTHRCQLAGGNLSRARGLSLTITAVGAVPKGRALRRDGASPGDLLAVSGPLGGASAGLRARASAALETALL